MPLVSDDTHRKNQLASDWMHQGMDLANGPSMSGLEQAVRCFDEAIALRRVLPLVENPFFRYGLSAGWINRGDALARLGGSHLLAESIKSYDEALVLLESLPLEENVLYPRRLAITWINRGIALQKQDVPNSLWEATECFREAIGVLESFEATAIADRQILLAGAWTNLTGSLMGISEEDAETVRSAAHQALRFIKPSEKMDAISAEMGLKARHALCRLAARDILDKKALSKTIISEATDAVDEAMDLAWHWKFEGRVELVKLIREIFRFGCRIYEHSQPHFLAEYLMECLALESFGKTLIIDQETFDAGQAAIWSVLGKLQLDGFQSITTSRFEPFLSDIRELKQVEERLKHLRSI